MNINIRTSKENQERVKKLTNKFQLGAENVIARIAFSYTIGRKIYLKIENIADSQGKEYKEETLFGRHKDFYVALICQHYGLFHTDPDIPKYIKMHIDKGLELVEHFFDDKKEYNDFEFLKENIETGIQALEWADIDLDPVVNTQQKIEKTQFEGSISIEIGTTLNDATPVKLSFNNSKIYNNNHIAVAGNSGTGKTQFALSFIDQLIDQTNNQVNYIYLDFKGLKKDDLSYYEPFFNKTKTKFIDAPHNPFPVNPITFIDNINEKNKIMGINKLVDIITGYSNLGKNQAQHLKRAITDCFAAKKQGQYPTFQEINTALIDIIGDKVSSLSGIIQSLSELELFDSTPKAKNDFLNENYYLSLSGDLDESVRFTAVFLIINFLYNTFMNMENTEVTDDHRAMRYVLVIDEAHTIFKEKKAQTLLEKILREIRSKGVSVFLLSQGIEEFNQPSFDFSSMCEMAILLDIKDKTNMRMINKFLGFGEAEGNLVKKNMEKIEKGQVISNIKEYKKGELFEIKQYGG